MKVLSLFDGMACGMLAMMAAGVEVESYDAYEIDKYAVKTATHNFPMIEQHGDVFKEDFTKYDGVDFLVGGSPCTYWSIAQTKNRETVASGLGWEMFSQYVRALHEAKPKYFIYENNKSMSKEIRASIDEAFGFEAVCINSALVSAQNRQRLYWVGRRNADGTYSKVNVEQPEDRGILLKDVLDGAVREKAHAVIASADRTTEREFFLKNQGKMAAEPVRGMGNDTKSRTLTANYWKTNARDAFVDCAGGRTMAAEPVCVASRGRMYRNEPQHYEARPDGKTNTLTSVEKDNRIAEPCCMRYERTEEAKRCRKAYEAHEVHHGYHELSELHPRTDGKCNTLSTVQKDNPICEPVDIFASPTVMKAAEDVVAKKGYLPEMWNPYNRAEITEKSPTLSTGSMVTSSCATLIHEKVAEPLQVGAMPRPNGELSTSQAFRVYGIENKSVTINSGGGGAGAKTGLYALTVNEQKGYAVPCEWDENGEPTKAVSCSDGKVYPVYKVENGQITIKDKQYPIKLRDGYYIIRKLTVSECMRLQTVPEWYDFSCVSNSQAYKMLGNGWTVEVIAHLIRSAFCDTVETQTTLF